MEVTLLYFDGCPNWTVARDRLQEALRLARLEDTRVSLRRVTSPQAAEAVGFRGSPSVLIDGRDPFGGEAVAGVFACRVYQTPAGPQGVPSLGQFVEALEAATSGNLSPG